MAKAKLSGKKKSSKKKSFKKKSSVTKNPRGGLTAAGREKFHRKQGSNLKPGVIKAKTPTEMRRKGSFLRRHFANLRGPLLDENGQPTRLALQAHAWGEPVPKTKSAAAKLAAKGKKLLEKYHSSKIKGAKKKALLARRKKK